MQFVNDLKGVTIASISTVQETIRGTDRNKGRSNVKSAVEIGKIAAERAIAKNIRTVVFDRGGSRYHGKVKALADAAREAGLKF